MCRVCLHHAPATAAAAGSTWGAEGPAHAPPAVDPVGVSEVRLHHPEPLRVRTAGRSRHPRGRSQLVGESAGDPANILKLAADLIANAPLQGEGHTRIAIGVRTLESGAGDVGNAMTSSSRWRTSLSIAAAAVRLMRVEIGLGRDRGLRERAGAARVECAGREPMVGLQCRLAVVGPRRC